MLIPFLLLAMALSVSLAGPFKKIDKYIQEFPSRLFSFVINPIFIIPISMAFFIGLVFLIIFKYKSHREYKRIEIDKEEIKKPPKLKARKIYPQENEDGVEFEDQEMYEPIPIGTYSRRVNIRVDDNKRYFHKKNISKDEVEYLLNKDYKIKKYKNLLNGRMENFILLPRFNESFTHLFLVKHISEFLEKNGIKTELYITKKPDIVFRINEKRFAIEVETGSIFSKISRMEEKLKVLEDYDKWFFVVTDRNKVKKYKKYGDAVDKRYVKARLDKLIKLVKKAQK